MDKSKLIETIQQTREFIQSISEKIIKLTRYHHYIAKKVCKESTLFFVMGVLTSIKVTSIF